MSNHAVMAKGRQCGATLALVAAAVLASLALQRWRIKPANIALVFLTAVLLSAIAYGLWPALLASLLSIFAYNFFFLPPLYTLSIADRNNIVTLFFFAAVAFVASHLAARVRSQAIAARQHAAVAESLFGFSRKLAEVFTLDDLLWAICFQIARMLRVRAILLLPQADRLAVKAGYPPEDSLEPEELVAAERTFHQNDGAPRLTGSGKHLFLPLRTGRATVGLAGIRGEIGEPVLDPDQRRLLDALANQAALAIERLNLAQEMEAVRVAAETERLRSAMLSSLSHDLRTPLASILGSASSLASDRDSLDQSAQQELIATIREEAERLHRFIANLLDMTRLESGAVSPKLDLVDLSDVLGTALHRAREVLAGHAVEIDIPADLPLVSLDPVLFEQVLFNLLDNAAKYTSAQTRIRLRARQCAASVRMEISDEGEGIPESDLERVFEKFHRARAADQKPAGTGLGLAICRGFVEAMGGTIRAAKRARARADAKGAVFIISVPKAVLRGQEHAA